MMTLFRPVASRPAWKAIEALHGEMRELHLRELFADDPKHENDKRSLVYHVVGMPSYQNQRLRKTMR
jgi:hypothetical protein